MGVLDGQSVMIRAGKLQLPNFALAALVNLRIAAKRAVTSRARWPSA
jgi:hypothetical protein